MRVKIILLTLATLLFFVSSATSKNPVGKYFQKKGNHFIEINSDNTFKYEYRVDTFIDLVSEGVWEMKNSKTIVLNSYEDPILVSLEYEIIPTPGSKRDRHLNIELISNMYNEDDFFVVPFTNRVTVPDYARTTRGSQTIKTAFLIDSVHFKIYKDPIDNPRPRLDGVFRKQALPPKYAVLETEKIGLKLQPGQSANIKIYIYDEDFSYRAFKDVAVQAKSKSIIFRDDDDQSYELDIQ